MGSYRVCVCFRRRFKSGEAVAPQEVREIFNKYAEGGAHMTPEQLRRFLVEVQGEVDDEKDGLDTQKVVEEVLQKRHHITKFARHNLTLEDFHHYLFSTEFNPPIRSKVMYVTCFCYVVLIQRFDFWSNIICLCSVSICWINWI